MNTGCCHLCKEELGDCERSRWSCDSRLFIGALLCTDCWDNIHSRVQAVVCDEVIRIKGDL
jgi:hypothetical protein